MPAPFHASEATAWSIATLRSIAGSLSMATVRPATRQSIADLLSVAMSLVLLGGVLMIGCDGTGCGSEPSKRDAGGGPLRVIVDASAPAEDAGGAGDAGPDARAVLGDAGVVVGDAGSAASLCPLWRSPAAAGRGWLYARAVSNGVALTPADNHVDIYVRPAGAPLPGERADADDPCAVASYDQAAPKVSVLAAAIGFSSQEREFSPLGCRETSPCSVELPRSLDARFYVASAKGVSVRAASDVPQADRVNFAASVAGDALARSKALKRPLADELDRAEQATSVPALDLAIHYSEAKLRKKCDASCLDAPALDPAVRSYLKNARRPAQPNPFERRVSPDRWPVRER